jgi:hypothetical protein
MLEEEHKGEEEDFLVLACEILSSTSKAFVC